MDFLGFYVVIEHDGVFGSSQGWSVHSFFLFFSFGYDFLLVMPTVLVTLDLTAHLDDLCFFFLAFFWFSLVLFIYQFISILFGLYSFCFRMRAKAARLCPVSAGQCRHRCSRRISTLSELSIESRSNAR